MQTVQGELADISLSREQIIRDYRIAYQSRQASYIGRREVMSGKAKFGIFGDGKEVAQVALAHFFQKGDFRSGYYRDQTLLFALAATSIAEFFAQLYAHADAEADPASAGRQMNAHFSTRSLHADGSWKNLTLQFNSSPDLSPTGAQMPRLVGLAHASKIYRQVEKLQQFSQFSDRGNEIAFGTIGNAACAEGLFWESINAIGVLGAPMVLSIWDDEYGISVPNEFQLTKANIGTLLQGFRREDGSDQGFDVYCVRGWDYPELIRIYRQATNTARNEHIPAIIHVTELTQPQGHSTSGSHERYKSEQRLKWEQDFDCLLRMRRWILQNEVASEQELDGWQEEDRKYVEGVRAQAWDAYINPIRSQVQEFADILDEMAIPPARQPEILAIRDRLLSKAAPLRQDIMVAVRETLFALRDDDLPTQAILKDWRRKLDRETQQRYASHLVTAGSGAISEIGEVKPVYTKRSPRVPGFKIMNACFDAMLARDPRVIAFGEDVGQLGDVNQGFAGLQERYGVLRVADTGIREATILGQAIGMALRGLRPIAEIQYLDYLLYALQIMSDDLATLHWRSAGGQKAPVIVRTRGHRLEGIWHSGSQMAGIMHLVRGMHVLVPRNMTQAAGFYNTLLAGEDPGLIVEVLNGYRRKERLPDNLSEMRVPVGMPEVLRTGSDLTLVTYGASCQIAMAAAQLLDQAGVDLEVIDAQSLLPFDRPGLILESLKKTNRILFLDEDVPGGTTAYMLQEVLENQGGFEWLDSPPRTLTGQAHRPAYGSDGNYWSKPNVESVFETAYAIMHEVDPGRYPLFL